MVRGARGLHCGEHPWPQRGAQEQGRGRSVGETPTGSWRQTGQVQVEGWVEASGGDSTEGVWLRALEDLPGKGTGHQVSEMQRAGRCHRGRWAGGRFRPVQAQERDLEEGVLRGRRAQR